MLLTESLNFNRFPFYILHGPSIESIAAAIEETICYYLNKRSVQVPASVFTSGHPDLLVMKPSGNNNYRLEDIQELLSFVSLANASWPHRFVLLYDAHLLNAMLLSKMLKVLEDPNPSKINVNISILFICDQLNHMPPTILSRAQKIYVPDTLGAASTKSEDEIQELVWKHLTTNPKSFKQLENFLHLQKYLNTSKIFNVSPKERTTLLSSYLRENI